MRINEKGYICKSNSRKEKVYMPRIRKSTTGFDSYCHIGAVTFPEHYAGRRFKLKAVLEEQQPVLEEKNEVNNMKFEKVSNVPPNKRGAAALAEETKELLGILPELEFMEVLKINVKDNVPPAQLKKALHAYKSSAKTASKKLGIKVSVFQRDGDIYLQRTR